MEVSMSDQEFADRRFKAGLLPIMVIIVCILLVGVGAGIFALNRRNQAVSLIKVPKDYLSIQAAVDAAKPGDIIQVSAGTYIENLTLNKPVSLIAESLDQINPTNNPTIIDGVGGGATILIPPGMTQMPIIRGFVIQNSTNGIQASSEFIAEYNYFRSSAILVNYQLGGGGINRNNVYFQSVDDAIHLDNTDRPIVIESNRIMYAGDDGIEINLQNSPIPLLAEEVDVWNNMIIGSREDGIQLIDYNGEPQDTNRRFVFSGNLIASSKKAGIGLMPTGNTIEDYSGADTVEAIRVYNNTFYGNDYGISGGDNLVAFNNIITNSTTRGVWRVQGAPASNSILAFTLLFNNGIDADQTSLGLGIITGQDPLFAAAPNPGPDGAWETVDDDFSGLLLTGGSPAIDKGIAQYVANSGEPIPPNPITGFIGTAPDLGWREFGSSAMVTPTATPLVSVAPASPLPLPTLTIPPSFTPLPATLTPTMTPTLVTPASPTLTLIPGPTSTLLPSATWTVPATPTLTITSIYPAAAQANTTVNITITGTGFLNGSLVNFEGGQGTAPQITAVQVANSTTIIITVNVRIDAGLGTQVWDIRVTNPDGSSAILLDAFTVVPQ